MSTSTTRSLTEPPTADGSGAMFDRIARRYDLLNRVSSLGLDRGWRRRLVAALELAPGDRVLDLATGTADVALEILRQQPQAHVVGVDPARRMLDLGQRKADRAGVAERLELRSGTAETLLFGDDEFDALAIAFGIRNVPDRAAALREMARVTRPDGRVAILELTEPQSGWIAPLARFHVHRVVPVLGSWLSSDREYDYLERSIAAFPPPARFAALMADCGLEVLATRPLAFGACHLFVARPEEGSES